MFEAMTYENILNDMLSRVASDVDKREGSVIYDALAPTAYHLAQTYFYLDAFIDLVSGDTAVGEYLDKVVADYGLSRKGATYAVRKIETNGAVGIGTRWGINDSTYVITALLSTNAYSAICEQIGEIGNTYSGALENIDNVSGITASLTSVIEYGEDEESDDALRERFFVKVKLPGTSGNVNQYKQWALEVAGCGGAKVFPLWNGPGTVKIVIVDDDKQPVTVEQINKVTGYIETMRPIGAAVTIASGIAKPVALSALVTLVSGYSIQSVINYFTGAVTEYFKSIAFTLDYVSHAKIGTILLNTEGVIDYTGLLLNGTAANIALSAEEIPALGTINLEV
jgi:uncharacterized phage protein gp47/JayE